MSEKKLNFEKNKRLRDIMTVLNLSQVKIGKILGISQPDISRMYSDLREVGDSVCWGLVCKLSINPMWLEYGRGEMFLDEKAEPRNYPIQEEEAPNEMKEELAFYRKMVVNFNDIVERQNRRLDELEAEVKNSKDANLNPNLSENMELMFNK